MCVCVQIRLVVCQISSTFTRMFHIVRIQSVNVKLNGHFKCQSHSHVLCKRAVIDKNKLQNGPQFMCAIQKSREPCQVFYLESMKYKTGTTENLLRLFTSYLKSSIHHRRQYPLRAGLMLGWLIVLCRFSFP